MVADDPRKHGGRQFDTFPAAVLCYLVRPYGRFLLLAHPDRSGVEVVSGAVEAGETPRDAALRELREECGPSLVAHPLGVFHAGSFAYDALNPNLISLHWLFGYERGAVVPADDMRGASVFWLNCNEIADQTLIVPQPVAGRPDWLFRRAWSVYPDWLADAAIVAREGLG